MTEGKPTSKERKPAFYKLEHIPTGMAYGGSTSNVYVRVTNHFSRLKDGKHTNKALQEAYNNDPQFEVSYELTNTEDEAIVKEQQFLDEHGNTGNVFNRALDARAPGKGIIPSQETRMKISEAGLGRKASTETKVKMSNAFLGVNTGKIRSEEQREIIRATHLGVPKSEEQKENMRKAALNRCHSVVSIDGQEYSNMITAANALGICRPTVAARIKSENFPNWFIRNL